MATTSPLHRGLAAFRRSRGGNFAVVAAIAAPVLMAGVAVALDFLSAWSTRENLQAAADGAALAAATELPLRSTSPSTVASIVNGYVRQNAVGVNITSVGSDILANRGGVHVELSAAVASMFGGLFNPTGYAPHVEAVARLAGGAPLCALALEQHQPHGIFLQNSAHVVAPNCAVASNSDSPQSIEAIGSSKLQSIMTCSAGGATGGADNYEPNPVTDCPGIPDPLAGREEPDAHGCDHLLAISVVGNMTLSPGVYCGGLIILPGASATLSPGIYVMKNGPLQVSNNASLIGNHVGFYFVGDLSTMNLAAGSEVNLTAPKDGPMAGFLFFANRVLLTGDLNLRHFRISSDNARNLLGTIYLRDGVLDVDSNRPIADRSSYTVIVARRIQVSAGPDLVLNTDYDGTDVPVPDGVGPRKPHAYLAR